MNNTEKLLSAFSVAAAAIFLPSISNAQLSSTHQPQQDVKAKNTVSVTSNQTQSSLEKKMDETLTEIFGSYLPYKNFYFELKNALSVDDSSRISQMISYPIDIAGKKYKGKQEFINNYHNIFPEELKRNILNQDYKDLFAKYSGVMLADGQVWYSGICLDKDCTKVKVLITSVTPQLPRSNDASKSIQPTQEVKSLSFSALQFGYLKGTLKTYEGAGCTYYKREDEKNKKNKALAADDYDGKGLVVNYNGQDMLLANKSFLPIRTFSNGEMTLAVKDGKSKSCGEECSRTYTNFEVRNGGEKIIIPAFSICGS